MLSSVLIFLAGAGLFVLCSGSDSCHDQKTPCELDSMGCFLTAEAIVTVIRRDISEKGFHRDISTKMSLQTRHLPISDSGHGIIVVEHIPSGMFVDTFQLEAFKDAFQVRPTAPIDLEAMQTSAPKITTLLVYATLNYNGSDTHEASITMPTHLRYHQPSDVTSISFTLPPPTIWISHQNLPVDGINECKTANWHCDHDGEDLCQWLLLSEHGNDLKMVVPVALAWKGPYVACITIVSWLVGCVVIVKCACSADRPKPKSSATGEKEKFQQKKANEKTTKMQKAKMPKREKPDNQNPSTYNLRSRKIPRTE